jgi:hypothetical protein
MGRSIPAGIEVWATSPDFARFAVLSNIAG